MKQKLRLDSKRSRLLVFGIVLALVAVILVITTDRSVQVTKSLGPVVTFSTDTPDERKPDDIGYVWRGRASDPQRIIIPKLQIDAFVQNVGVDQNKQIAVPDNIHIAGWFVDTVQPGEPGLSIIDGHVNGPNSDDGVFARLAELQPDDEVLIKLGNGTERKFKVRKSQSLPTDQASELLFSQDPTIARQLNLITCTGTYDRTNRTYSDRHIVILEAE